MSFEASYKGESDRAYYPKTVLHNCFNPNGSNIFSFNWVSYPLDRGSKKLDLFLFERFSQNAYLKKNIGSKLFWEEVESQDRISSISYKNPKSSFFLYYLWVNRVRVLWKRLTLSLIL
jgi:hypothetical protein